MYVVYFKYFGENWQCNIAKLEFDIVNLQFPSKICINSEFCAVVLYKIHTKVIMMIKSPGIPLPITDIKPGPVSI